MPTPPLNPLAPGGAEMQPSFNTPQTPAGTLRECYVKALSWSFTLFNSVRALAYLPTLWVIHSSGDSSQHSLWTWVTWLGANATMAAWLFEHNGRRCNRAVVVNAANASMCLLTVLMILRLRF